MRRELDIGLVEHQQRAVRHRLDHRPDPVGTVPGAHRVVGVGDVDELGAGLGSLFDERLGVLVVVAVGHGDDLSAEARDMVVEGRVGARGGDHCVAGADREPDEVAEQPVDAFADHDIGGRRAGGGGQRLAQVVARGIAVFPDLGRRFFHRRHRAGRGTEDAFIGAEPRAERPPPVALLRFRPDEGDGGGEAVDERGVAWSGGHGCEDGASPGPRQEAERLGPRMSGRGKRVEQNLSQGR